MNHPPPTSSGIQNPKGWTRHPILHEDRWIVAIHKPDGVLSHPNPPSSGKPTARPFSCAFEGKYDFDERRFDTPAGPIWLVHRLDQDTSGVLLAARSERVAAACRALFEENRIQKIYSALVAGKPSPPSGLWKDHLQKRAGRGMVRSVISSRGPPNAELKYETLSTFNHPPVLSLLKITLLTGRTHQIRLQAATRRHPVAGDRIYGDFPLNKGLRQQIGLRRLFLHAGVLRFTHTETRHPLVLEAPTPSDLAGVLVRLREGVK